MTRRWLIVAALAAGGLGLAAVPGLAQEKLRIGFITTTSGGGAVLGKPQRQGFELAVQELGGRLGGIETELTVVDDQQKPDVGLQIATRLVQRDRVQFIAGVIWSNVLLSMLDQVTDADVFLVSTNAGPSEVAGKSCKRNFFNTSWQNDQFAEATGRLVNEKGVKELMLMAPNYQAGKDTISGLKRYYKGSVTGEILNKLGSQDFQPEISQIRAARPGAVWTFQPGAMAVAFMKQWHASGLAGQIPLYTTFTVNWTTLPGIGEAALGSEHATFWSPDLENAANRKFVASYRARYNEMPSMFAAQAYDGAKLIDAAVRGAGGDLQNKDRLRQALRQARFESVRGGFRFNTNHFPIQDFFRQYAVKDSAGQLTLVKGDVIFKDHRDAYYRDCPMKG